MSQPPYGYDPNTPGTAPQRPPAAPAREPQPATYPPPPPMPPGYGQLLYPPPPSQPLYPPPPGYGQPGAFPPPPAPPSQPLYPPPPGYGQHGASPPPPMGYAPPLYPAQQDPRGTEAVAGLILGIISIPAVMFGCGIVFGILGLVFSIRGRASYTRRSLATVGLVCSCVGLGLTALKFAAFAWSIVSSLPH